ncbi:hypothetical protein B0H14DRAFT_3440170 [Mycena olivaceomarginata]|nr:hypothetical protein B0H14DRAFT_3440170 [Mycena olivaceomarginata]
MPAFGVPTRSRSPPGYLILWLPVDEDPDVERWREETSMGGTDLGVEEEKDLSSETLCEILGWNHETGIPAAFSPYTYAGMMRAPRVVMVIQHVMFGWNSALLRLYPTESYFATYSLEDVEVVVDGVVEREDIRKKGSLEHNHKSLRRGFGIHDDALSATKMTTKPSDNFNKIKNNDGTTHLVRMRDGTFRDGTPQSLYLPNGRFKGMKTIIQERRQKGYDLPDPNAPDPNSPSGKKLKAQCGTNFKCRHSTSTQCCLKKMIYSEPDFQGQNSMLEEHCEKRGAC